SAFVRAVKGIIDIVTFIVTQGAQIVDFVNAVLDAVIAIANGGAAGVPKLVEAALATSIPLLIGFLASLLGIGSLANKVKSVFHAVSKPVNRAIDKIIDFITKKGKALWNKLKKKHVDATTKPSSHDDKNAPGRPKKGEGQQRKPVKVDFTMQGESHRLTLTPSRRLMMASLNPKEVLDKVYKTMEVATDSAQIALLSEIQAKALSVINARGDAAARGMREFADLCEEYGERFDRSDIEPELEEQGVGSREPVKRPKARDRVSSERLRKLADKHKGKNCVAILKVDSREYEGWSSGRSASDLDSRAVKDIRTHSPGHALGCAEVHCISQAYRAEYREKTNELPVENTGIEMVHADRYEQGDRGWYGKAYPACPSCDPMLQGLKVTTTN
ncbi:hypothetical protein ABZY11_43970, partial [Streptomyces sp. NPDC006510]